MNNPSTERLHYWDNLRALAMLLGVVLHAGLAYADPSQNIWLPTDSTSSRMVDFGVWFIHLFRMALFFFIAGYFAKLLVLRRGVWGFLWNRTKRVLVPFVMFYPFLLAGMTFVFLFGLTYIDEPRGILALIRSSNNESSSSSTRLSTLHLWFLYYLAMFSCLAALTSRCRFFSLSRVVDWTLQRRWTMAIVPLLLIPGALGGGVPISAPESFVPHWWPFLYYGLFYLAGWYAYARERLVERWCYPPLVMLLVIIVLVIPYYRLMPILDLKLLSSYPQWQYQVAAILSTYLAVFLVAFTLLLGRNCLAQHNAMLRFLSDASYWIYLVHLPIVLLLQTLLTNAPLTVWCKVALAVAGTFTVCMVTYITLVRHSWLGQILNGSRPFP